MSEHLGIGVPTPEGEPVPFVPTFPEPTAPPVEAPPVETPPPEGTPPTPAPAPSPEEPDTGALPSLEKLALLLLILALVLAAKALTDFFNWLFRTALGPLWPRTGSKQLSVQPVTRALGSYLGTFGAGFDSELGVQFTRSAETTNHLARFNVALATKTLRLAQGLVTLERQAGVAAESQNVLRHQVQAQGAQDAQQAQRLHDRQAQLEQRQTVAEGRLDELQHSITKLIEPELETLRGAIPELGRGAAALQSTVASHGEMLGIDAMVGTVAVAMGRLGAGWTRCDTNRQIGEQLCGNTGNTLTRLLRGNLDVLGILELCTLGRAMIALAGNELVTGALGVFSTGLSELNRCMGAKVAPPLPVRAPSLPPPQRFGQLPPARV